MVEQPGSLLTGGLSALRITGRTVVPMGHCAQRCDFIRQRAQHPRRPGEPMLRDQPQQERPPGLLQLGNGSHAAS